MRQLTKVQDKNGTITKLVWRMKQEEGPTSKPLSITHLQTPQMIISMILLQMIQSNSNSNLIFSK